MRRLHFALLGVIALLLVPAAAQGQEADTVRVVHLVIDGLHPNQIGPDTPNLAELKATGTWWEQARAVMASETLPNHVAMATGAYPGRNGIPGNDGRARVGDESSADPDLGQPDLLRARSLTTLVEEACPDLRTVTAFSKAYVYRIFADDPADANFPQPQFNIPVSDHAPDTSIVSFIQQQLTTEDPPDYLFANLGDVDRAGHIDETGVTGVPVEQRAAIQQTDTLVGSIIENLKSQDLWEDTVLIVNSDHSMDWSTPDATVDVAGALEADPRTQGRFFVGENGGAALIYLLDPSAPDRNDVLAAAREVVSGLDGIAEVLYREPNPADPGHDLDTVHPAWHVRTPRIGELFAYVTDGHRIGTFDSNPLPGNHGHAITRHATFFVAGGWDGLAQPQSIAPSDPGAVNVVDDTAALPEQAENVDAAPTWAWLLGVPAPTPPQWQGQVLDEAFTRQPAPVCAAREPVSSPTTGPTSAASPADDGDGTGATTGGASALPTTGAGAGLVGAALLALSAIAATAVRPRWHTSASKD